MGRLAPPQRARCRTPSVKREYHVVEENAKRRRRIARTVSEWRRTRPGRDRMPAAAVIQAAGRPEVAARGAAWSTGWVWRRSGETLRCSCVPRPESRVAPRARAPRPSRGDGPRRCRASGASCRACSGRGGGCASCRGSPPSPAAPRRSVKTSAPPPFWETGQRRRCPDAASLRESDSWWGSRNHPRLRGVPVRIGALGRKGEDPGLRRSGRRDHP